MCDYKNQNDTSGRMVDIDYTLANGETVQVPVSPEVAAFLEQDDKRLRTQRREERRFLDPAGYVEGETELLLYDLGPGVLDEIELRERSRVMNRAINSLPARQKYYTHAYYFKGHTMQEIADMEEISKVMVHRVLKKARINLRTLLTQDGSFDGYHALMDDDEE